MDNFITYFIGGVVGFLALMLLSRVAKKKKNKRKD